ncbi:hypothetical protein BDB00DRAFT_792884 [Zychaea mexicana]|uniref:uncharacterized protein n=1 Tax=Zychaea mexicana TaxID=64656 RepID=UPI0022FDB6A2|nr:uncharacterized protein BDB00DRAFT_792884 [Zychaea mexicana]KAI9484407.1 hypothetical protein BDB00DRAFT_792884 [Zychaea mexicana]
MDNKQGASRLDINSSRKQELSAPTPQNTPINPAPITSNYRPSVSSISEDTESKVDSNKNNHGSNNTAAEASNLTGAFTSNPALISMLQGKLGNLVGRRSDYIESLPVNVKRRIHGLQHFQSQHAELEGKFQEEVLALEKKYLALYTPLYTKRAQVITGTYEPADEEVALGEKVDQDTEEEEGKKAKKEEEKFKEEHQQQEQDDTTMKGIPEFWLTALKNHPQISESITDQDELVLKHLVDIRMSYMDKPGFKLHFDFADDNEFFSDKTLTKTYYYQEHAYGGDYVYDHAEGCVVHWKEGKDLTVKVETKKQRHKGTNKTRVVKRTVPADTFFSFFSPPSFPDDSTELDEEEAEGLDAKLEVDYETGEEFKDKVIPHAIDYFTGKALEYEDFNAEDEFEQPAKGENAPECKQS